MGSVSNRKSRPNMGGGKPTKEAAPQVDKLGTNNPFNPIMLEEGEIADSQGPVVEVGDQEGIPETELGSGYEQQRQSKVVLVKANSVGHLDDLIGKVHMDKVPLFRSSSMSDIPMHCKESRLDYLREEFHHYHLIAKHLQKTKEETLKRLQLMEARQSQSRDYPEVNPQVLVEDDQMELVSQVPETQAEKNQGKQIGDISQKKKKGVHLGKKPITRATRKNNTPSKQ